MSKPCCFQKLPLHFQGFATVHAQQSIMSALASSCEFPAHTPIEEHWYNSLSLYEAAENHNLACVQYHVKRGANVNVLDYKYKETALHVACRKGHLDVVKYLVKVGHANVNAIAPRGRTPLHEACHSGSLAMFKCLIEVGHANVNAIDGFGHTPLHVACSSGRLSSIAQYLIESAHADVNACHGYYRHTALLIATEQGQVDTVRCLLKTGRVNVEATDRWGRTALHHASDSGHLVIVECLITMGRANVNATNSHGLTPLLETRHLSVLRYLVQSGGVCPNGNLSLVHSADNDGRTALHIASGRNDLTIVHYLVETKKVDVNVADNNGRTALHAASFSGRVDAVRYLVETGKANVNVVDNNGETALLFASRWGYDLAIVQCLIATGGANVDVSNQNGETALHWASMHGSVEVVKYLVETGHANVNIMNNNGRTALYEAHHNEQSAVVQYLLETGRATPFCVSYWDGLLKVVRYFATDPANANEATKFGERVLHEASKDGYLEAVQYMVETGCINVEAKCSALFVHRDDNRRNGKRTKPKIAAPPLYWASLHGHLAVVQYLIETARANVHAVTDRGWTALHVASAHGHVAVVQYLIAKGANLHATTIKADRSKSHPKGGDTALHLASRHGRLRMVLCLMECYNPPQIND
jgi:ankyrin repeat protein